MLRAVIEAVTHLLYWMKRVWMMLLVTTEDVSVISARSPEYWLPIGASDRLER